MKHYTRLTKHEIDSILGKFNIPKVSSFKLLSGGSENTNYLIEAESKKYVLCVCEQKSVDQAKELVHLLGFLKKNSFKTSEVVYQSSSEPVAVWEKKPIIVKNFIEGKIQKDLSPPLLKLIGQELAKLHKIEAPEYLPRRLNYGKEQFVNVEKYAPNSEFDSWLKQILTYLSPYFKLNLPKSLIHSDLFWDNVIVKEDESAVIIMDLEEASHYYRVFDIGMTIIGICGEGKTVNLKKAGYLLEGYQSEIQLRKEELKALKAYTIYAGVSMTFWRHQNFNHIKPDPKMFDHYLGLKVLVDYMLEQDDDCFFKH